MFIVFSSIFYCLFYSKLNISNIYSVKCENHKWNTWKSMVHNQTKFLTTYCLYLQQLSMSISTCKNKTISQSSSNSRTTYQVFPSKSNFKIKLMKCFNHVQLINHLHPTLLNFYHSLGNIIILKIPWQSPNVDMTIQHNVYMIIQYKPHWWLIS